MNIKALDNHIKSYSLIVQTISDDYDVLLVNRLQANGNSLWGIQLGDSNYLDKESLMFTIKPSNNDIDEEYLNSHRFETIEDALKCFDKFLKFDFTNIDDLDEAIKKTLSRRQEYIKNRLIPNLF